MKWLCVLLLLLPLSPQLANGLHVGCEIYQSISHVMVMGLAVYIHLSCRGAAQNKSQVSIRQIAFCIHYYFYYYY